MVFSTLLILGLAQASLEVSKDCPKYDCAQDASEFPFPSSCLQQLGNTYYARPCKYGYICNAIERTEANCTYPVYQHHQKLAGEKCTYDSDCTDNNYCVDKKCKGLGLNKTCAFNGDCDAGLFCFNDLCKKQLKAGEVGCLEDADCENDSGCELNSETNRNDNLCRKYFSVEDYGALEGCKKQGQVNYICKSGFCALIGEESQCYPAPVSNGTLPIKCNATCTSGLTGEDKQVFNSSCTCGYNKKGQSYCGLFPGDKEFKKYSSMVKDWVDSEHGLKCNTQSRFGENCMRTYWDDDKVDEMIYKYFYATHYALLNDIEECVEKVYFPKLYPDLYPGLKGQSPVS